MISVICVYNDAEKLNRYLLASLAEQSSQFELITIDNTGGKYGSAPEILNRAALGARHRYLMFVHQDVALGSDTWLADVEALLGRLRRLGAAGPAGMTREGRFAGSIRHGEPPRLVGEAKLLETVQVQTLDGCLIVVPRKVFAKRSFDEQTCRGWHLYVADYCLSLARAGYRNFALPNEVYHESTGPADKSVYKDTVCRIILKHRKRNPVICTTVGQWNTEDFLFPPGFKPHHGGKEKRGAPWAFISRSVSKCFRGLR